MYIEINYYIQVERGAKAQFEGCRSLGVGTFWHLALTGAMATRGKQLRVEKEAFMEQELTRVVSGSKLCMTTQALHQQT